MKKYTHKTIVVPWDFSDMSKAALTEALEMVDSIDQIEVVHVTPYPAATEYGMIWGTLTEDNIVENLTNSFRKESEEAGFPELKFTAQFGDPGSRIADVARERKAGLIVISSHGHKGISRLLLGSVAERVVRMAPCPVLVLRQDPQKKAESEEADLKKTTSA